MYPLYKTNFECEFYTTLFCVKTGHLQTEKLADLCVNFGLIREKNDTSAPVSIRLRNLIFQLK
jgi:hypothetical protein